MSQDVSQQTRASNGPVRFGQAVTGVVPPALAEARIREAWPTVMGVQPALASVGEKLLRTLVLAPFGLLILGPLFALKFAPLICKRYTLTNRRLMIQRGWKPSPVEEIALSAIDDVRLREGSTDRFDLSGTLEVVSGGQVKMTLLGVPEPDGFLVAVRNAVKAWAPAKTQPIEPASAQPTVGSITGGPMSTPTTPA